ATRNGTELGFAKISLPNKTRASSGRLRGAELPMKISILRVGGFVIGFGILLLGAMSYANAQDATGGALNDSLSTDDLVNPDGTLDLKREKHGKVDLKGWTVSLDSVRGPILTPQGSAPNAPQVANATGWGEVANGGLNDSVYAMAVIGTDVYVGG